MFLIYSFLFTLAFLVMLPFLIFRRRKYASGFLQRLGRHPEFAHDGREVVWLHCVSVGEANAARPLVDELLRNFPEHRVVVSTTTRTGQALAESIFQHKAESVFYFPFDWKFSVRRALGTFRPSIVLLMETEIWPRFFREVKRSGAKLIIVNGRLSEKSFKNYSIVRRFIGRVLEDLDLALMQGETDAERIVSLGLDPEKVVVTGNIKFDQNASSSENGLTEEIVGRFGFSGATPLIVAASTHSPEEKWVIDAFQRLRENGRNARLLIAPRHPERFNEVAEIISKSGFRVARRSATETISDRTTDVILLDSIGELRSVYPLAEVVFVGGSLIPHGGQSILEPAAAGKPIVTGPFTVNFDAAVKEFLAHDALIQLPEGEEESFPENLASVFAELLHDRKRLTELGENALTVIETNRGATFRTIQALTPIMIAHQ
jgi:3-deoxy-D-manno-octulosonic-acid transferase